MKLTEINHCIFCETLLIKGNFDNEISCPKIGNHPQNCIWAWVYNKNKKDSVHIKINEWQFNFWIARELPETTFMCHLKIIITLPYLLDMEPDIASINQAFDKFKKLATFI